jgi:tRNA(Ser,Leu) C12 N-acetylase TAN1
MDTLLAQLGEAVKPFIDRIGSGSFHVRVERRGHAGELHSQQMEQELAKAVLEALAAKGMAATIAFKNPDAIIAVEIVGDECGVGVLPRALRDRFPLIKVP